ncbi:MAG TPA: hypothetical protein VFX97_00445 [Pyrinomonadaceae bacterium]|nr:hypothetical protein [Pyrinomonadaceae bacterium]
MIRFHLILLTLAAAVFLGSSHDPAQEKSAQPKLAIEILDGRKRIPAPIFEAPSGGVMEMGTTDPIPDFKPTGAPLTRIRIRAVMEGDAARVKIAGVFDDSEPADAPGPKYGPVERPIGSYLAREGEKIEVNELKSLGFKPLALKVVRFVPEVETPGPAFAPVVTNKLKSVEVVVLSPVPDTSAYRLTVRNISSKNIVALDVYVPKERGRSGVTTNGSATRPVMKPGGTSDTLIHENRGRRLTNQGYVAEEPSNKIIVGTVVFDDETYEGEAATALQVIGNQTGRRLQFTRAVLLLKNILEAPDQDSAAMLGRARSEVSQLTIDVDSKTVDELLARFPELPAKYDRKTLASIMMRGFLEARQRLLSEITEIENAARRDPASTTLVWQRISSYKEQLETEVRATKQATTY